MDLFRVENKDFFFFFKKEKEIEGTNQVLKSSYLGKKATNTHG